MIRTATADDAQAIADIYNHYVLNSIATFEEIAVTDADMAQRIAETQAASLPWLVSQDNENTITGFAFASKWKGRCAYRFAVEVTVYVASTAAGLGWGTQLYQALFTELRNKSMHAALAGISLPNEASIALHEKFDMNKVAHFKQVGYKFERWIDVGYWQAIL